MNRYFMEGFEKEASKKSDKAKMNYIKKVIIPSTLAFGAHGALFAPKGGKLIKALESGSRGMLTSSIIGAAAHLKKQLEEVV